MIPLLLIALGLGAALTVYEFSPRTRARVDAYARAIRSAHAAHQAADTHLRNANATAVTAARHAQQAVTVQMPRRSTPILAPSEPITPPVTLEPLSQWAQPAPTPTSPSTPIAPPSEPSPIVAEALMEAARAAADAAVVQASAAIEENQSAAQSTADAAQSADTEAQRQEAEQSAAMVVEREKKIADALARLGVGQCGVKSYSRVTERLTNALLSKLNEEGMVVTGTNPWNIDTKMYGVKLRAVWDPSAQVLKLIVTTGKGFFVTCDAIWERVNPKIKEVLRR